MRWSDNDKTFGPFIYARDRGGYRPFAVVLCSANGGDAPCNIRFSALGHTLIAKLPAIIQPHREYVSLDDNYRRVPAVQATGGYWQIDPRKYGFSVSEGFAQFFMGRSTLDSETDRSRGWFLPWTQWRYVRFSLYGLAGEHLWTQKQQSGARIGFANDAWEERRQRQDTCPSVTFIFDDFDGERLTATTRIEESEWLAGEGWFRWISLFRRPKIVRSLDIAFSGETGRRKGSWKGGTIGTSINMMPGELHEAAFRRYCDENNMTFIGATSATRETTP
jgi:hypothetical protein